MDSPRPPSFDALGLDPLVVTAMRACGFETPLPVQTAVVPQAVAGRDLVVSAETGSGKTLSYLAPIFSLLLGHPRGEGPAAVVLVPTRELAGQVGQVAAGLGDHTGVETTVVHGGVPMRPQTLAMRRGTPLVIATPGRLLDHLLRGNACLEGVRAVVLDEADRMLEMGFVEDVERIVRATPQDRRTVLCSATITKNVERLAAHVLRDPVRVRVGQEEGRMPAGITHEIAVVRMPLKRLLLFHLLGDPALEAVLVFTKTKFRAQALAEAIAGQDVAAAALHSDLPQADRTLTLDRFRAGELRVLVATDLAERGLDVPRVTHVIHFDPPNTADIYVHRVGRTARVFGEGVALTLCAAAEEKKVLAMAQKLEFEPVRRVETGFDYDQRPQGLDPLVDRRTPTKHRRRSSGDEEDGAPRKLRGLDARGQPKEKGEFWKRVKDRKRKRRGGGRR